MSVAIPASVLQFDELMSRMEFGIMDLQRWIARIIRYCNRWLPWLGPAAKWVLDAMHRLEDMIRRFCSEVGKFITRPGHPLALWQHGTQWITEVGKRAGDRVGTVTSDYMQSDDKWKGPAAEAFIKTLPPQKAALEKVLTISGEIGDSLHNVAIGIGAFWLATVLAVAKLITELIPEAAATAVPPTAPAGIGAAVASAAGFIVLWGAIIAGFWEYLSRLFREQSDLIVQLSDNQAFPGPPVGSWPQSTTANLSDGSVTDGDNRSDWELRP
jgi:hypothetical protein